VKPSVTPPRRRPRLAACFLVVAVSAVLLRCGARATGAPASPIAGEAPSAPAGASGSPAPSAPSAPSGSAPQASTSGGSADRAHEGGDMIPDGNDSERNHLRRYTGGFLADDAAAMFPHRA
jgi:hypothetical protein